MNKINGEEISEYIHYGEEWEKEMMKYPKKHLIEKIRQYWQLSQQPEPIEDIELLTEEIRQIKAIIIHFATLDKMPTLELLDSEHLIAHVVTIAKDILSKYPPKSKR